MKHQIINLLVNYYKGSGSITIANVYNFNATTGNLSSHINGGLTETFDYDVALDRLKSATIGSKTQTFGYSVSGNIVSKTLFIGV